MTSLSSENFGYFESRRTPILEYVRCRGIEPLKKQEHFFREITIFDIFYPFLIIWQLIYWEIWTIEESFVITNEVEKWWLAAVGAQTGDPWPGNFATSN